MASRIAFPAVGNGWNELMDTRFGRAGGFLLVDSETLATSYIDNRANAAAGHGAGTGAAQAIADAGADTLIAAEVGPKAESVLKAAGVKVMVVPTPVTVAAAFEMLRDGSLPEQ